MSGERLDTAYDDAGASPGLLLWQVTNRWQAATRAALKPLGLTHVQFVLLASLTWLGSRGAPEQAEPVTQQRLAEHAATDTMMTSQVLRVLEQRGLVERREHPTDRRARALRVTPEGAALANRAVVVAERVDAEFFGRLGPRVDTLTVALRDLATEG